MSDTESCDACGEVVSGGDAKLCVGCNRMLCYLHYPERNGPGAPDPNAICKRCIKRKANKDASQAQPDRAY
jgi:hypothetical protein